MNYSFILSSFFVFSIGVYSLDVLAQEDDILQEDFPVVLTPAKMKQSMVNAPAAVTVITHQKIKSLGLRSLADILRHVPGMIVGEASGNDHRLAYHSTNGQTPRRMQVLIDGEPAYGPGLAVVRWNRLPIAIDNIDRIEITRGSNSAAYGTNSMLATVNILSKDPDEYQGYYFKLRTGSLSTRDVFGSYAGKMGSTLYRLSIDHQEDDGFDRNFTRVEDRRDGFDLDQFSWNSVTELDTSVLKVNFGHNQVTIQDEFEESNQQTFPDQMQTSQLLSAEWNNTLTEFHEIQFRVGMFKQDFEQRWRSCYPTLMITPELRALYEANQSYVGAILNGQFPSGGSADDDLLAAAVFSRIASLGGIDGASAPTCLDANQDFNSHRYDVEFKDTYVFNDDFRLVSGIGFRQESINGETYYFGNRQTRDSARLFFQSEYIASSSLTINFGSMFEFEEDVAENIKVSPRLSFNYHLDDRQTLKFIVSKAIRTPDIFEYNRDWNYRFRNLDPLLDGENEALFFLRHNPDESDLLPEEILSREIIYYANFPEKGISIDVKLFNDKLENLISEDTNFFSLDYTNNNELVLKGIEFQLNYILNEKLSFDLTYAHIDNNSNNFNETSIYAKDSGTFVGTYTINNDTSVVLAYYAHLAGADNFFDYHRVDLIVNKTFSLKETKEMSASFMIRNQDRDQSMFVANPSFTAENIYDNGTHYYLTLDYSF